MNPNISSAYVAILDNRAVAFETNLSKFWELFNKIEPECRNYKYYQRKFQESDVVKFVNKQDKIYILQKVL